MTTKICVGGNHSNPWKVRMCGKKIISERVEEMEGKNTVLSNSVKRMHSCVKKRLKRRRGSESRAGGGWGRYLQDGGLCGHGWYPLEAQEHAADSGAETEAFGGAPDCGGISSTRRRRRHHHQCQDNPQDAHSPERPPLTPSATHRLRMTDTSATVTVDILGQSSLHTQVYRHHAATRNITV